jgi:hypothetical protein
VRASAREVEISQVEAFKKSFECLHSARPHGKVAHKRVIRDSNTGRGAFSRACNRLSKKGFEPAVIDVRHS